jgi:hypothetical protein
MKEEFATLYYYTMPMVCVLLSVIKKKSFCLYCLFNLFSVIACGFSIASLAGRWRVLVVLPMLGVIAQRHKASVFDDNNKRRENNCQNRIIMMNGLTG